MEQRISQLEAEVAKLQKAFNTLKELSEQQIAFNALLIKALDKQKQDKI